MLIRLVTILLVSVLLVSVLLAAISAAGAGKFETLPAPGGLAAPGASAEADLPTGLSCSPPPAERDLTISFDYESARAVLDLFDAETVTDEEIRRVAELPGNRSLIRQAARFSPGATEQKFRESLKAIVETGRVEDDVFAFSSVKKRLEKIRFLIQEIEKDPERLKAAVAGRIRDYIPGGLTVEANVYFILGGTSDGFVPSEESFCVALHYFEDDIEGLKVLMAHELYHIAQRTAWRTHPRSREIDASLAPGLSRSLDLLRGTLNEGTASLVGDPLEVEDGKNYIRWFQTKFRRNLQRIEANFALFETILFRFFHDPEADPGVLYNIGFSGMWDSPIYFVGYHMARSIERYEGREAVAEAMRECPLVFFNRYAALTREHEDPDMIRFSRSTEDILRRLQDPGL